MTEHDTRAIQESLAQKLDADLAALKSNTITTERPVAGSVAEQLLGIGATIKGVHRDLDTLQAEMIKQLDALRKRLGGRG
jgi:hypothetical protein